MRGIVLAKTHCEDRACYEAKRAVGEDVWLRPVELTSGLYIPYIPTGSGIRFSDAAPSPRAPQNFLWEGVTQSWHMEYPIVSLCRGVLFIITAKRDGKWVARNEALRRFDADTA